MEKKRQELSYLLSLNNYGIGISNGLILLSRYGLFINNFIEELQKSKTVKNINEQVRMAEAFRISQDPKGHQYRRWLMSKQREVWRISKTDEEKEKEAMQSWKLFQNNKDALISNKK